MAENKVQDYTEETDEGHVDTREANFECEKKDENLGCDMGIDVAGYLKGRCPMIGILLTLIILGYFINSCIAGMSSEASCKI